MSGAEDCDGNEMEQPEFGVHSELKLTACHAAQQQNDATGHSQWHRKSRRPVIPQLNETQSTMTHVNKLQRFAISVVATPVPATRATPFVSELLTKQTRQTNTQGKSSTEEKCIADKEGEMSRMF